MKALLTLITGLCLALPLFAQDLTTAPLKEKAEKAWSLPTTLVAQTTCPISGEELESKEHFVDYEGHRIYTCCGKCAKKVAAKPERTAMNMYAEGIALENLQTTCVVSGEELEDRDTFVQLYNKTVYVCCNKCKKKVAANPAKYLDKLEGRHAQKLCVFSGEEIDPAETVVVEGMKVGNCCGKCAAKGEANPAAYFAKLQEKNVVAEPASMLCPVMPSMEGSKKYPVTMGAKRYYFCSAKTAVMFAKNPGKYLPKWLAAQESPEAAVSSGLESLGGAIGG